MTIILTVYIFVYYTCINIALGYNILDILVGPDMVTIYIQSPFLIL